MTETQQQLKYKRRLVTFGDHIEMVNQMRSDEEKKGGGLMIIARKGSNLSKIETINSNILHCKYNKSNLIILLVYCGPNNYIKNTNIYEELKNIISSYDEESKIIVLGDMNAHVGFLGPQPINKEGERFIEFLSNNNLILLNQDENCNGEITYHNEALNHKSVVDFIAVNANLYKEFREMEIDEQREKFELSDHNVLEAKFNSNYIKEKNQFGKNIYYYYKINQHTVKKFKNKCIKYLEDVENGNMDEITEKILMAMNDTMKTKSNMRKKNNKIHKRWMTNKIEKQIKIRRKYNKEKRKAKYQGNKEDEENYHKLYEKQKDLVKNLKKIAITQYEKEKTNKIYQDSNRSKKVWEYIKTLKDIPNKDKTYYIYEKGIQLSEEEAKAKILKFWENVYQHHPNNMKCEWSVEDQKEYRIIIDQNVTFDITQDEIKTQFKRLKENKAAGPNKIPPKIIKELSEEESFMNCLENAFNIIYNANNIPESWKISNTTLINKKPKPSADQLRPITITNIMYKIYMGIIKDRLETHIQNSNKICYEQMGFTKGRRIEYNLFILKYCIENSFF